MENSTRYTTLLERYEKCLRQERLYFGFSTVVFSLGSGSHCKVCSREFVTRINSYPASSVGSQRCSVFQIAPRPPS